MGVVSRRWVWVETMGVASGCGCKEVIYYIDFLIILILTPLVSVLFLQQHPYFLFFILNVFRSLYRCVQYAVGLNPN